MSLGMAFGFVVRRRRLRANLTQANLAAATSLDRTYISMLERGVRQPTLTTIFAISQALGIAPAELIRLTQLRVKNPKRKFNFLASKRL